MKKNPIPRKNGSPSHFFWREKDGTDRSRQTVYKQTDDGIKRMRGVTYDVVAGRVNKN